MSERAPRIIAILGALLFLGFGAWAFLDAKGFYEGVAVWPPFYRHFIHDIGAFQIGLGLIMVLALTSGDTLLVALAAVGAGQAVHAAAHWMDRDLGGKASDPWAMSVLAALLLAGAVARMKSPRRTSFRRL